MTETYRLTMPANWRRLDLAEGAKASIDSLVDDATAKLPRDSAAAAKHRLRARLTATVDELQGTDGARMQSMFFPVPKSGADILPMTLTCGGVDAPLSVDKEDTTAVLLSFVKTNPTAKPVDADGVVALRTHSFRDITAELTEETEAMIGDLATAESPPLPPEQRAFQMRASYLFAAPGTADWHLIVGSATLPTNDADNEVTEAVLGLFDAIVSTLKWSAEVENV